MYQLSVATIRTRRKADGIPNYLVQIRISRDKTTVYQESQTFARKHVAQAWAKRRETELSEPGAIERAKRQGLAGRHMIERYLMKAEKAGFLVRATGACWRYQRCPLGKVVDPGISQKCRSTMRCGA
ncbi:hypothetical protein [Pseudomonas sp.]|uniref:hypothetical protein n=1 Tax=Pseudomonas sp. TaxID=306 RepID=UPI0028A7325B|nr:hypothetical protein [Pseudomonas sp.]